MTSFLEESYGSVKKSGPATNSAGFESGNPGDILGVGVALGSIGLTGIPNVSIRIRVVVDAVTISNIVNLIEGLGILMLSRSFAS